MNANDMLGVVALLLTLVTIILQVYVYKKITIKQETYIRTKGTIVNFRRGAVSHSTNNFPSIEFIDNKGEIHVFQSKVRNSNTNASKNKSKLDKVDVCYNPEDPTDAFMDIKAVKYLPLIVGGMFSSFLWMYYMGGMLL